MRAAPRRALLRALGSATAEVAHARDPAAGAVAIDHDPGRIPATRDGRPATPPDLGRPAIQAVQQVVLRTLRHADGTQTAMNRP